MNPSLIELSPNMLQVFTFFPLEEFTKAKSQKWTFTNTFFRYVAV
jgi:hypothetical protein